MEVRGILEKLKEEKALSEEELAKAEDFLYKENPFEIEIIQPKDRDERKIVVNPLLANLLKQRGENLSHLKISRYDDTDVYIHVEELEKDLNLQPHQIKLVSPETRLLFYDEEMGEIEHLRLVFGEKSKIYKSLQLLISSMNPETLEAELLRRGLKFDELSEEKKKEDIKWFDKEAEPQIKTVAKVYYSIQQEKLRDAIGRLLGITEFYCQYVLSLHTPPTIPNARYYKNLKKNEVALNPIYRIKSPYLAPHDLIEIIIVHPILGESFSERMRVVEKSALPLRYMGFSEEFLNSYAIPLPEKVRDFNLKYEHKHPEKEKKPEEMKFKI